MAKGAAKADSKALAGDLFAEQQAKSKPAAPKKTKQVLKAPSMPTLSAPSMPTLSAPKLSAPSLPSAPKLSAPSLSLPKLGGGGKKEAPAPKKKKSKASKASSGGGSNLPLVLLVLFSPLAVVQGFTFSTMARLAASRRQVNAPRASSLDLKYYHTCDFIVSDAMRCDAMRCDAWNSWAPGVDSRRRVVLYPCRRPSAPPPRFVATREWRPSRDDRREVRSVVARGRSRANLSVENSSNRLERMRSDPALWLGRVSCREDNSPSSLLAASSARKFRSDTFGSILAYLRLEPVCTTSSF